MGLDNFFQNSKNEPVDYTGAPLKSFVYASIGLPEQGAWRGKYYFPIVQAMLNVDTDPKDYKNLWLFNDHTASEIHDATKKFSSYDLNDLATWQDLLSKAKKYDFYGYVDEYTQEEMIELVKYFQFYSQFDDLKLIAWY